MSRPPNREGSLLRRCLHRFRYRLGGYAVRGLIFTTCWAPDRVLITLGVLFAWITHALLFKYRIRMEENIAVALSDRLATPAQRKALAWSAWKSLTRSVLETAAVLNYPRDRIIQMVQLRGEEHLREALSHGKGVLALSAHLGGFSLIGARLAAQGYAFSVVVKHPSDEQFARLITRYRAQIGIQTISAKPRREAVRAILKALRENRIVLIIADEFKSGDVMVDFMGQCLPAPRGPATLALRTGAVTLPMFAARQLDDSMVLTIGAPLAPVQMADLEQSIEATTGFYTRHLEDAIRRYPEQWNWLGFPRSSRRRRSETRRLQPQTSEPSRGIADR